MKHGKTLCMICLENYKVYLRIFLLLFNSLVKLVLLQNSFYSEKRFYTSLELETHNQHGDKDSVYRGHPLCELLVFAYFKQVFYAFF